MEKRTAILGIFVYDRAASAAVNALLHEYGEMILGRMGVPHHGQACSIITLVLEATNSEINALSGKLGRLEQVQAKVMLAK